MSEDPTKDLARGSFEDRVLSELGAIRSDVAELKIQQNAIVKNIAALDQRLTALEERVDARLKETRPIWEALQEQIKKLDRKFDLVIKDLYEVRTDVRAHDKRLTELENRPS